MKAKKSQRFDIDRKRGLFLRIGFIVSITLVILAFEWGTSNDQSGLIFDLQEVPIDEEIIDITVQEVKKPKPLPKIIQIENDEKLPEDQPRIDDVEISPEDSIEILPFINIEDDSEPEVVETVPFVNVQKKPKFPGGEEAMMRFIQSNIKHPEPERIAGIQGKVMISFIIGVDGSISNINVLKGLTNNLNNEAKRIVRMMPKWSPGEQRNKPVRVIVNLPFNFILSY